MHHRRLACSLACTPGVGLGRSTSARDTAASQTPHRKSVTYPVPAGTRSQERRAPALNDPIGSYLPSPFVHLARPPASKRFFPGSAKHKTHHIWKRVNSSKTYRATRTRGLPKFSLCMLLSGFSPPWVTKMGKFERHFYRRSILLPSVTIECVKVELTIIWHLNY